MPTADRYQRSSRCNAFDDLYDWCDITRCRRGQDDRIRPVPLGRCQPVRERKIGPEVDDCQTLSAGSGGESENPQLMATPRWEAGEQQWRACAIHRSRVEGGAQSSLHGGGRHVLAGNGYASLDPSPA
jgi:hypothetical protein